MEYAYFTCIVCAEREICIFNSGKCIIVTLLCRTIRCLLWVVYRPPVAQGSIRSSRVFMKPKAIFVTVEWQEKRFSATSARQEQEKSNLNN